MFDFDFDDEDEDEDPLAAWRPLAEVARFATVLEAQLMRSTLDTHGIRARVRDEHTASIDPALIVPIGYVRLEVAAADAERARAVIAALPREAPDDEPDGGLRCPECGSSYVLGQGERCRCRRCDHRFDADAPPLPPLRHGRDAPADDGATVPVFRLRRDHRGLGLFLGAVVVLFAAMVLREVVAPGWVGAVALALPALGWLVGRGVREEVCSEPSCRAPLARAAERCLGCGAAVAWPIRRAGEHYAARARWLRGERPRTYR